MVHLKRKGQLFNKQEENQGFDEVSCTPINKEDKALVVHGKKRRHLFNWGKKIKGSMILFFKVKE